MKEVKDIFSTQASVYATYRPVYPNELYEFIYSQCDRFELAWDCGTGNGQVANHLAERFDKVYATDISTRQIENAVQKHNIEYDVSRAEATRLLQASVDLVTVGTALHWFDFDNFYSEVRRVAKKGAIVAAWAYAPFRSIPAIDNILDDFYFNVIHDYWDPERKFVEEGYKTIPFPFEEIPHQPFEIVANWTNKQFIGFLNSWSAVQHFIKKNGTNPVETIEPSIYQHWPDGKLLKITFPLFVRIGLVT